MARLSRPRIKLLLLVAFAILLACAYVTFSVNDSGSVELAAEWTNALGTFQDKATFLSTHPEAQYVELPNGEWIVGFTRDSHGRWRGGGGTFCVRDSNGVISSYRGHVCGERILRQFCFDCKDLPSFYRDLKAAGFVPLG